MVVWNFQISRQGVFATLAQGICLPNIPLPYELSPLEFRKRKFEARFGVLIGYVAAH